MHSVSDPRVWGVQSARRMNHTTRPHSRTGDVPAVFSSRSQNKPLGGDAGASFREEQIKRSSIVRCVSTRTRRPIITFHPKHPLLPPDAHSRRFRVEFPSDFPSTPPFPRPRPHPPTASPRPSSFHQTNRSACRDNPPEYPEYPRSDSATQPSTHSRTTWAPITALDPTTQSHLHM